MTEPTGHQLAFDLTDAGPVAAPAPTPSAGPSARPAAAPPDDGDRRRIAADLDATLFVEAGAGAGKTTALVGRIVALIRTGIPIESIAAITFTEKAASELRHRIRVELVAALDQSDAAEREQWQAAVDALDHAPIGTLHAFARRLLFEFPVEAGLPPGFDVLDELESRLALDERWEDLQDDLLDDASRHVVEGLPAADFVQLCEWGTFGGMPAVRRIVEDFQANWDLVDERVACTAPPRPSACADDLIAAARAVAATPTPPGDGQEQALDRLERCAEALARAAARPPERIGSIGYLLAAMDEVAKAADKKQRTGNQANWKAYGGKEALQELRAAQAALVETVRDHQRPWREYRRLVVGAIAADFVLDGARQRAANGALEFHDLLVLARRLLSRDEAARRMLHERYRRVLLDEFQDTDPIQLEIAVRLTAPPEGQGDDVAALRPLPGRLFVVGDPKQSIYRFRRADIASYLRAADQLEAERATLSANFRSSRAVIDWVNGVFGTVISHERDVQPAYGPLDVARPGPRDHGSVSLLGAELHGAGDDDAELTADELRAAEAADVAAVVATALRDGWLVGEGSELRPCRPGDIAILLPARTSLPILEAALGDLAVPARAENAAVVYTAPEIRHLLLTLRAAADPTDELALVSALRSPLYGCSDVELFDWRQAGGRWNVQAPVPDGMHTHAVAAALAHVRSIAERVGRDAPADLLSAVVADRRVLELALAGPTVRDVWRRVRYVIDQARAWTDAGGRGLRRYLAWAAFQAGEGRASDTILPERDHDAVRIMTVHAAKGLEFPITIVSGMTTKVRRTSTTSVAWFDGTWTLREQGDELFEAFKPLDEQMGDAERRRLLYVACTRAVDHLVVSVHRKAENPKNGPADYTSATVLASSGADGFGASAFSAVADALPPPVDHALELPWADPQAWATERARTIVAASARSSTSATRLAAQAAAVVDPGLDKDPVDLDLPPWQRGRYGTAIGRAVHAVLQDADLATGTDLDVLATAQCASEGIFDLQPLVASLARSALSAPIVQAAAAGAEHWRELFVVAPVGATVLEGYIDLLVRTADGLVIVDYKTDQWSSEADRAARVARYRRQLAAYGVALSRLLDEPIVGGVLVRCIADAPAEQHAITAWADACAEVEVAAGQSG